MPAECFEGTPFNSNWIEIFHSLPSWERCFIRFLRNDTWSENARYELQDAFDIRKGFRVFRVHASELVFYLTNGSSRTRIDNGGKNFHAAEPGRFVVAHTSLYRVGDADVEACIGNLRKMDK
eukprot:Plantae.Rhodophyta-Purpureofilum_apyrenoidigerum.ctg44934.p1 GENE.Plantae.Rhodophyta-Purpureofilum_apyrenoidigerum.ctg44934~~Plantae.Rhodophyta-Purpureofilum_apyrenoidigerum.ctg44934.p1  ORF type:complete len:122 (+),score=18.66 Plantae.Rhodophyta-Purpureofilum_apyrenoidigerum.ctg44934:69-434(+)